jgi:hypothetical protein
MEILRGVNNMGCNAMYRAYCEFMNDAYGDCSSHTCLIQLLGEEELLRKCEHCGLDKEYPVEYMEIKNKLDSEEEGSES